MTRSRLAALAFAAAALVWWLAGTPGVGGSSHPTATAPSSGQSTARSVDPALGQQLANLGRNRSGAIDWQRSDPQLQHEGVVITGKVLDRDAQSGVPEVEVVFKSPLGESSTTSGSDGSYRIEVSAGTYRAFVRDDNALSVGVPDLVRVPGSPSLDDASAPDEGLMPTVVAVTDVDHVDLSVVFGGRVDGTVVDRSGHAVVGAVLRARGNPLRPALGSDIAESDEHGHFDMRLPPGQYVIDATHAQLAGVTSNVVIEVARGQTIHPSVTLTSGCVISGHVIAANGQPAGDGAIERRFGPGENDFGPAGRIESDGSFRWVTAETVSISLRAWPWKSPPANELTFDCRDGARYANVTFRIPNQPPDIAGTLVDANGAPVALGFIDINPVDGGFGQQERTDANGRWAVYHMPAGHYRVTATAPARGVIATELDAPRTDVKLVLGGTGRIEGKTTTLAEGSFELTMSTCDNAVNLPHAPRLVAVHEGHFTIDDVPACDLVAMASWQGVETEVVTTVPANDAAIIDLDIGPAQDKTVHGIVRDSSGHPVAGATVIGIPRNGGISQDQTKTDASGGYSLRFAGNVIMVTSGDLQGFEEVPRDGSDDATVDIVVASEVQNEVDNGM